MLATSLLHEGRQVVRLYFKRNLGVSTVISAKASDPIQQLFVDKLREYSKKCKTSGNILVEASPEIEKELKAELERVAKQHGGGPDVDMTKFPTFKFEEPTIDPIDLPK